MRRDITAVSVLLSLAAATAVADPRCAPFQETETLPLAYLDRPDPVTSRVTAPVEDALLAAQISGERPGPLTKIYCRIGIADMVVRFVEPLRDDSIAGMVTEAVYAWRPDGDPPGWQLSALRRQPLCARGSAPFAPLCP